MFITVPLRRRGLAGEEVTPVLDELCRGMFVLTSLVRRTVAHERVSPVWSLFE